jgi:hypothetical protein
MAAICEHMHQVVGNVLRTLFYSHVPQNVQDANALVDYALATASYALRSSAQCTLHTAQWNYCLVQLSFIKIC